MIWFVVAAVVIVVVLGVVVRSLSRRSRVGGDGRGRVDQARITSTRRAAETDNWYKHGQPPGP